jgi:glutamine amidotransferase|tara:strand:- start:285 stop:422 length:138 start_codon:yes stop_codon:yes gene_type:complete
VVGEGEYGTRFVTAISKANIHATRFHPEKSRPDGLTIFGNFLERA